MQRIKLITLLLVSCLSFSQVSFASERDHEQLRALKTSLIEAVNTQNVQALKSHLHDNIVWTLENGQTIRKLESVDKFLADTLLGENAALKSFEVADVNVGEESILLSDNTAISYGSMVSNYEVAGGPSYSMKSSWSATLTKVGGEWKVINFQNTVNLLDNPILAKTKQFGYMLGAGLLILGLFIGLLLRSRRK